MAHVSQLFIHSETSEGVEKGEEGELGRGWHAKRAGGSPGIIIITLIVPVLKWKAYNLYSSSYNSLGL